MKKINKSGYAILKERVEEMDSRLFIAKRELRVANNELKATKERCAKYEAMCAEEKSKREQLADKYEQVINDMYEHMGFIRRLIWDFKNRKRV